MKKNRNTMISEINNNRSVLYENLINDGYFRGDDGEINYSYEDFCDSLNDKETVKVFYENLLDDGYFRDEEGNVNFSEEDFMDMLFEQTQRDYYPITENQRGVYIDWEMNRDTTQYNIPEVRLLKEVNPKQLKDALVAVVEAHPYLKTHFEQREGDVVQLRLDDEIVNVTITQLDEKPTDAFFQSRVQPFNLLEGPLYRLEIYDTPVGTYLFTDFHHTIFDGASSYVFARDLESVLKGETVQHETYSAFDRAVDEEKFWNSDFCKEAELYFDGLLRGKETTKYPNSLQKDNEHSLKSVRVTISGSDINRFCKDKNVTASNYFLTIFLLLLHRITREENVTITTIHHGRTDLRMMDTIGMFVKTQLVTSLYTPNEYTAKVSELVRDIQQQVLKTQSYDIYSFTKIVERYGLSAEIMYAFQGGIADPEEEQSEREQIQLDLNKTKLPLSVMVLTPHPDEFLIALDYDSTCYNQGDMEKLAEALKVMAVNASLLPGISSSKIPVMDEAHTKQVIAMGKGEDLHFDPNETFVDLFRKQADKTPDALAVADVEKSLTYGELDLVSNALAHQLIEKNIMPNDFVGVLLERTIDFPLSVLAIHKAGAAYTPLDREYPNDRLSYMIENSEMKVMLTTRSVWESKFAEGDLPVDDVTVLFLEDLDLHTNTAPINLTTPDNLAYMIYTSGSTGVPKGAMLHHRGLTNFTHAMIEIEKLTSKDITAAHRSFSFDAHIDDLFPILAVGGQMHIMPSKIRKDITAMKDFIVNRGITGTGFTTSLMILLLKTYPDMPLRFITAGGEKLSNVQSDKITIINLYGPTECTNDSMTYTIEPGIIVENIPIGRPVPNTYGFIVSKEGNLLPQGMAGELCIAGPQVGYGYWKLPERTADVFVDCPYVDGIKMYHTGDLCRYNAEGQIEYLGRIDNQVKLRGYRIELGEIEKQALSLKELRQAVALIREIQGTPHLVLYYTLEDGVEVFQIRMMEHMESTPLAEYMHPEFYVQLESMPTLPNGKINRRALPEPEIKPEDIVLPETEKEQKLYDIAIEILGHNQFGVTSNLISMGLTSLSAMKMSAVIRQRLDWTVPTAEIMKCRKIRDILLYINEGKAETRQLITYETREYYPITENQRGIYVDWELNRETTQYNMPSVREMGGKDAQMLCEALKQVIKVHPYLKTRFEIFDGDIVQHRQDELPEQVDLIILDYEPGTGFFQSRVRPFDLLKDRLYRLEIYQTPTTVYLFMDIHHIIFDGGSNLVFIDELLKVYNGETLEVERYSAYDHALNEKELRNSEAYAEAERHYDELLSGAETAILPHNGELNEDHATRANAYADIDIASDRILAYCKRHELTANNFFLTVVLQVLHRMLNEQKLTINTISNGRNNSELMKSIGMFVQTLPVVSEKEPISSKKDFATIALRMQQQSTESQLRDFYPFTDVSSRHGIISHIMFIYQGGMDLGESTLATLKNTEDLDVDLDTVKVPLAIMVHDFNKGMFHLNIEYDASLYNQQEIGCFANCIKTYIEGVLTGELIPANAISLLNASDSQKIVEASFGGELDYEPQSTFISRFLQQVSARPQAIALVDEKGKMTYQELDTLSNRLAAYLIKCEVGCNDFVGIMMERCKEFMVAVIGVMKAGAAYIPIDKSYPEDRIQYMIENSGAKIVLDESVLFQSFNEELQAVPINKAKPSGLAYMIYTSGSTGKPKGVMQSHRSLNAFVAWYIHDIGLNVESKNVQHPSFSFDASLVDLVCPLAAGGSVYILSETLRKDMAGMYNYIKENNITGMTLSTQMGMAMLNTYSDMPLDYIMMGGEKLLPFEKTPIRVINGYGPTEFTVCSSYHIVDQEKDVNIPIGCAVPNTWSFVCDSYGNLLPLGTIGELCLAGPQIAEGYWQRPELTAEKFVACKFLPGNRMYRTGDLVRYNEEGKLEFVGRIDHQVKLRGFRIELGEIENCASLYEDIQYVAAEVKTIGTLQHLILYYTAETVVNKEALSRFLAQTLVEYMVPTIFVQMEEMPLTPNGKINRKELPIPSLSDSVYNIPPQNEKEAILLRIAYELLEHDGFGVTDNLMSQGLTSLLGIKYVARASLLKIDIKLDDLMKTKTIRGVLEHNMNIAFWKNTPEPGKPVVVVTCGETPYKDMTPYIEALTENYSVFVIESILEHYKYIFMDADINEVVEMYYTLIDFYVGSETDIKCFTGHCFGGELSYRLANKWKKNNPQSSPAIVMLDVFWRKPDEEPNESAPFFDLLPQEFIDRNKESIEHYLNVRNMYDALNTNDAPEIYCGQLVLFRTMQKEPLSEELKGLPSDLLEKLEKIQGKGRKYDNEAFWKEIYPDLECIHVDANHMSMLASEHVTEYINWINHYIH